MKITRNDRVEFRLEGDEKFDLDFYRKVIAKVADWPGEMSVEVSAFEKTIIVRSVTTIHASHDKIAVPSDQRPVVAPSAPAYPAPAPAPMPPFAAIPGIPDGCYVYPDGYRSSCLECGKEIYKSNGNWYHERAAKDHAAAGPSDETSI